MNLEKTMEKLLIIDGHTDIPRHLYKRYEEGVENAFHKEHYLPLKRGHVNIAVVNVFTKGSPEVSLRQALMQINLINEAVKNQEGVILIKDKNDLQEVIHSGELGLILSLEGFEPLGNNLELLNIYHQLGIRLGMLTWNNLNAFASGSDTAQGLSSLGLEAVDLMQELDIICDVSHLNEKGFWEVLARSKNPIIASHSNARSLFNHPRNLKDDQIKAIAHSGGVIGLVPYFSQVDDDSPSKIRVDDDSSETINDYIKHIEYVVSLVGYDYVSFGFDFNIYLGDFGVKGIEDAEKIKDVIAILLERGHKLDDVEKIAGKNLLGIFNRILK